MTDTFSDILKKRKVKHGNAKKVVVLSVEIVREMLRDLFKKQ